MLRVGEMSRMRRVSFKYDPFGRRIYKSFSAGTTSIYGRVAQASFALSS
jgi:hypothetical protein